MIGMDLPALLREAWCVWDSETLRFSWGIARKCGRARAAVCQWLKIFDIAVDADGLTADVAGQIGGKEKREVRDVLGLNHSSQRNLREKRLAHLLDRYAQYFRAIRDHLVYT